MRQKSTRGRFGPAPRPLAERFWEKVDKTEDCWWWTGAIDARSGYGYFSVARCKAKMAHRVAWELTYGGHPCLRGPMLPGTCVLHHCDVKWPRGDIFYRRCVRPDHLWLGSRPDNIHDMDKKGRRHCGVVRGEQQWNAKLTEAQVREARADFAAGVPRSMLRARYGWTPLTLWRVLSRQSWKHVD